MKGLAKACRDAMGSRPARGFVVCCWHASSIPNPRQSDPQTSLYPYCLAHAPELRWHLNFYIYLVSSYASFGNFVDFSRGHLRQVGVLSRTPPVQFCHVPYFRWIDRAVLRPDISDDWFEANVLFFTANSLSLVAESPNVDQLARLIRIAPLGCDAPGRR